MSNNEFEMNFYDWFYNEFELNSRVSPALWIRGIAELAWNASKVETVKRILDLFKEDLEWISKD